MNKSLVGMMLLLVAAAASAQIVYKYQKPDGTLVYSDKPIHGARLLDKFPLLPSVPVNAQREAASPPAPSAATEGGRPAGSRTSALDQADENVKAAQKAVEDAKDRLEKGVEPRPGERVANVGGTSRLREDYFARVQQLEQDLKDATAQLDEAYRKRNEAK